jgi:hypothetical protein
MSGPKYRQIQAVFLDLAIGNVGEQRSPSTRFQRHKYAYVVSHGMHLAGADDDASTAT